jgi:hypothetical protein
MEQMAAGMMGGQGMPDFSQFAKDNDDTSTTNDLD